MLSNNKQRRYSRNITLPEVGEEGQERLLSSKVLVVGAGGLGSPLLLYLASSGVGTIGIIDDDKVDLSNLQRQIIHETGDIGRNKTQSAADAIYDLNPDINVECYEGRLTADNIDSLISKYNTIADCSDNFETRFLINEACYKNKIPLVSAAIHRFEGQLSTFKPYLGDEYPCYRCIYSSTDIDDVKCAESGVLGSVAGIMGSWQATEVIKELLNIGESLSGSLVIFDALSATSRKLNVRKDRQCKVCG